MCLVGAGPGDPGLITDRGLGWLRQADVVVFDALVNPVLLEQAPAGAERIDVGKRAGVCALNQDQINQLLVAKARGGRLVVRLKGGDPYVFGRGAEEMAYVASQGLACQLVPGVTAGVAVPAAAGIAVTHRRMASTVTFVTGHEDPAKGQPSIDYRSLAGLVMTGGTVCFYMAVARLGDLATQLRCHGLNDETPVAVIQWGTLPRQRTVRTTLARAPDDAAGLGAPAIIVVGVVAGLQEPGLDAFTNRPLFGQRVVITRARKQALELRLMLDELGAQTLEAPMIEFVPPEDWSGVDEAIRAVDRYDWLVLTSTNGVAALDERLGVLGFDARHLATVKVAVVGHATAQALRRRLGIRADLVPDRFVAESLVETLIDRHGVAGKQFLLLQADIARQALRRLLVAADACVDQWPVYRTTRPTVWPEHMVAALRAREVDWVTFTSASTANHMVQWLGRDVSLLQAVKIASIGPVTSQALRRLGLSPTAEAATSDLEGLVEAMVNA